MTRDPAKDPIVGSPENQATERHASRSSGQDRQEQYQQSREHARRSQLEQDREARIRRRAYQIWEQEGQAKGMAEDHWNRAARDLDQEEAKIRHEGNARKNPAVVPQGAGDIVREKS